MIVDWCHTVGMDTLWSMVLLFLQLNGEKEQFLLSKKEGRRLDSLYGHCRQRNRERERASLRLSNDFFLGKKNQIGKILPEFSYLLKLLKTLEMLTIEEVQSQIK